MMTPELKQYIEDARKSGIDNTAIRGALVQAGWSASVVEEALGMSNPQESAPPTPVLSPELFSPSSETTSLESHLPALKKGGVHPESKKPEKTFVVGKRRRGKGLLFFLLLALVVGGGALAYPYVLPMLRGELPYSEQTFFSDMTRQVASINSASYDIAIAVVSEPRNPNFKSLKEAFPEYSPRKDEAPSALQPFSSDNLISNMIRSEEMYATLIPTDVSASVSVRGGVEKGSGGSLKPSGRTDIIASFSSPDLSAEINVEIVAKDGDIYARVNRIPSLFFNLDAIKGKWIKVASLSDSAKQAQDLLPSDSVSDLEDRKAKMIAVIKELPSMIDESGLFFVSGKPERGEYAGEMLYKYDIKARTENFSAFYEKLMLRLKTVVSDKDVAEFEEMVTEGRKFLANPDFKKLADHFSSQSALSVWVSEQTKMPARFMTSGYFVPSESRLNGLSGDENKTERKQIKTTLSLSLSDFNKDVSVEAPAEFMTLEEATSALFPASEYKYGAESGR